VSSADVGKSTIAGPPQESPPRQFPYLLRHQFFLYTGSLGSHSAWWNPSNLDTGGKCPNVKHPDFKGASLLSLLERCPHFRGVLREDSAVILQFYLVSQ
jgi:hypothetical protein